MRFVTRSEQDDLTEQRSYWRRPADRGLTDKYFDGEPLPRELVPRHWRAEGDVHEGHRVSRSVDSTRYFRGPEVTVLRDDLRRTAWAGVVQENSLRLRQYPQAGGQSASTDEVIVGEGDIWRYFLALNKHTGGVTATWVLNSNGRMTLWHGGEQVDTAAATPDFPSFAYSQVPVGHVQDSEPPYGILGYKDRDSGRTFVRRVERGRVGKEQLLTDEPTVGGVSVAVVEDQALARVDLFRKGPLVPAIYTPPATEVGPSRARSRSTLRLPFRKASSRGQVFNGQSSTRAEPSTCPSGWRATLRHWS